MLTEFGDITRQSPYVIDQSGEALPESPCLNRGVGVARSDSKMRDLPHANSTRPGCEKYDLPKDRILTLDFEPAVAAKGNPTKVLQDLPDWRLRFRDCKFRRKLGSRGETLVRDIQKLALKLSQERDARKITELN